MAHFRGLVRRYQELARGGEITPQERERVELAVRRAEAAIRQAERVQGRGQGASRTAGVAVVGAGVLAADDATVVGVADDVAIPFVLLFAAGAAAVAWLGSSSDADKQRAWNAASGAVAGAVGTIEGVLAGRRNRTENRTRAEPRVIPRTEADQDRNRVNTMRFQVQWGTGRAVLLFRKW